MFSLLARLRTGQEEVRERQKEDGDIENEGLVVQGIPSSETGRCQVLN